MNETIDVQLKHRTIREFKSDPIPEDTFQTLMDVAMHTPTSRGIQSAQLFGLRIKENAKSWLKSVVRNMLPALRNICCLSRI